MYRIIVLVCCIYAVIAEEENPRIIGGNPIDIEDVPYQVSVYDAVRQRHHCGGSIISQSYILTAGHCAQFPAQAYRIRVGTSQSIDGGVFYNVIAVFIHEGYRMDGEVPFNDIAIMRVAPRIVIDGRTTWIVRLAERGETFTGMDATLSGWGHTTSTRGRTPNQLQALTVRVLSRQTCDNNYMQIHGGIRDGQLCAEHQEKTRDLCDGDSGGPLVVNGKQIGIVSWSGPGCALPNRPGVYTEVAYYRDWIDRHINA